MATTVPTPTKKVKMALSLQEKWNIVSPLLVKYMLPLCKFSLELKIESLI